MRCIGLKSVNKDSPIGHRLRDLNPGHTGQRRVLSPLRWHFCFPSYPSNTFSQVLNTVRLTEVAIRLIKLLYREPGSKKG